MSTIKKLIGIAIILLSGCTMGDNLERRYTHETPVPVQIQRQSVCLLVPVQTNEKIVSAVTYNAKTPQQQVIFPSSKQVESGAFCISPAEFKFIAGEEYFTLIEVNSDRQNGLDDKSTRRAFSASFRIINRADGLAIEQAPRR